MPGLFGAVTQALRSSASLDRLRSDLERFEVTLGRYKAMRATSGTPPDASTGGGPVADGNAWIASCDAHLARARQALSDGAADLGFESLLHAERDAVAIMPVEERVARVDSLRHEVERKLGGSWRGTAASALLSGEARDVPIEAVREALFQRDTTAQNMYRKIALLRRQLLWIFAILAALLVTAVVAARFGGLAALDGAPSTVALLPVAIDMGLLGGTLSAAYSASRTDPNAKIPDVQRSGVITLAKCGLGGAAAIPVLLLLRSGVLPVVDVGSGPLGVLFFCFLAGFSERWFFGTLDTFTRKQASHDGK